MSSDELSTEANLSDDVVLVSSPDDEIKSAGFAGQFSLLRWIPVALGVFIICSIIAFPVNPRFRWAFNFTNWDSGLNLLLAGASLLIGIFLIIYGIGQRHCARSCESTPHTRFVLVPLVLWLLAVSAVGFSLLRSGDRYSPSVPGKPCVELYLDVATISQDRRDFRMPAQDPDELRCGINKALFG